MTWQSPRRLFLQGVLVAATGGLAGCSNESTNDDEGGTEGQSGETSTATPSPTATESTPTATPTRTPVENPEAKIDNWLKHAQIYDGTITDERDQPKVTVSVGADAKDGFDGFSFDPPAIRITTGTEVRWIWTGDGGKHNVKEKHGRFTSGEPESGGGTAYLRTFERPGLYLYKCTEHGNELNMRGAVLVDY